MPKPAVPSKGVSGLRKLRDLLTPSIPQQDLFPSELVVHFSYHKCLTGYYDRVLNTLAGEFGFYREHFGSDVAAFEQAVFERDGKRVVSVNNFSELPFDRFPSYRGSHFIRDPRDLVVSGYRYHLWTHEPWCNKTDFDWPKITGHPHFTAYIESDESRFPRDISFKDYLNTLDEERGMILELIRREPVLKQMEKWNFNNDQIIEYRYEDIIGNEKASFKRLFEHYRLHPRMQKRGIEIAEQFSLKNRKKSDTGHVRKGTARQWESEFSPLVKRLFKENLPTLLVAAGYEKDDQW